MELGVQGEDLVATAGRDNEYGSSQDEYDYSDNFIDDGPLETGSSSESSSEDGGGSSGDDACYKCKENPASRVETRREQVDKKGVVRSEEELQGEETISSLRPSRTPAVHWQQSGSSLDSDTGVPRKGGKEGIESERRILERFGHAAQRRREGR
ncbi:hypothetical protein Q5P01_010538 [Channa striata]|uniref:Uncharacterized protein n=1 Tax=Channa striata TaxID=64152 RepID=A0AA88SRW2_CHASR|nr:hypothetical protein Q5P01_010538 [Channa striata]